MVLVDENNKPFDDESEDEQVPFKALRTISAIVFFFLGCKDACDDPSIVTIGIPASASVLIKTFGLKITDSQFLNCLIESLLSGALTYYIEAFYSTNNPLCQFLRLRMEFLRGLMEYLLGLFDVNILRRIRT